MHQGKTCITRTRDEDGLGKEDRKRLWEWSCPEVSGRSLTDAPVFPGCLFTQTLSTKWWDLLEKEGDLKVGMEKRKNSELFMCLVHC